MANVEYLEEGCLQRDSAEHEEYAGAQSAGVRESKETDGADLLERILSRDNLNSSITVQSGDGSLIDFQIDQK